MKTKKIILTILTAILLTSIFVVTVAAAGAVATTDGKACARGKTVTLNVNVSEVSNVFSGAVAVEYDSDVLQLVSARWNTDDVLKDVLLQTYDMATDKGAFAFNAEHNISGKIFSVTFMVLEDAPLGKSEVSCTVQLKKQSGDSISVTSNAGYVDVTCNHKFDQKNDQHLASGATCTSPATYYYTCSICGAVGTTTYTSGSALPHTFDQKKATAEYLVAEVKCVSEADYYYSCSCGAKGTETFKADASWSHNYSGNWFINANNHWHQCADCGEKKDEAAHTPNSENVCTICNFQLSTEETHEHSFSKEISKDDKNHWYECSCGLRNEEEPHQWSEGKCTVCGAEDPDYTPPVVDPETPDKDPEQDPSDEGEFNLISYLLDNVWLLILIGLGLLMLIAFIVLLAKDRYFYY